MKINLNSLALKQVENRVESIKSIAPKTKLRTGWIRFMRKAMGLTSAELANIVGISSKTVIQSEQREMEGKVTIATLKKMAEAMECEVIYAFVPKSTIRDTIISNARKKAIRRLSEAGLHMKLENQNPDKSIEDQIEALTYKLIEEGKVWS
jgi:predicted DNA-binding mobile mystery protein A